MSDVGSEVLALTEELQTLRQLHYNLQKEYQTLVVNKVSLQERVDSIWGQYLSEKQQRAEIEQILSNVLLDSSADVSQKSNGLLNAKECIENVLQENEVCARECSSMRASQVHVSALAHDCCAGTSSMAGVSAAFLCACLMQPQQDLKKELALLRVLPSENDKLKKELSQLTKVLKDSEQLARSMKQITTEALRTKNDQAQKEQSQFVEHIQSQDNVIKSQHARLSSLEQQNSELSLKILQLQAENEQFKLKEQQSNDELSGLKLQLERTKTDLDILRGESEQALEAMRQECEEKVRKQKELSEKMKQNRGASTDALKQELADTKAQLQTKTDELLSASEKMRGQEQNIRYTDGNEEVKKEKGRSREEDEKVVHVSDLLRSFSNLKKKLADAQQTQQDLQSKAGDSKKILTKILEITKKLAEKSTKVAELKQQLQDTKQSLATAQETIATQETKIKEATIITVAAAKKTYNSTNTQTDSKLFLDVTTQTDAPEPTDHLIIKTALVPTVSKTASTDTVQSFGEEEGSDTHQDAIPTWQVTCHGNGPLQYIHMDEMVQGTSEEEGLQMLAEWVKHVYRAILKGKPYEISILLNTVGLDGKVTVVSPMQLHDLKQAARQQKLKQHSLTIRPTTPRQREASPSSANRNNNNSADGTTPRARTKRPVRRPSSNEMERSPDWETFELPGGLGGAVKRTELQTMMKQSPGSKSSPTLGADSGGENVVLRIRRPLDVPRQPQKYTGILPLISPHRNG